MLPRASIGTEAVKRCHARPARGSTTAGTQASPAFMSTALAPPSAHAQPQTSIFPTVTVSLGAGETITDSGAIDHTGVNAPVGRPELSRAGSLYQRVVNGSAARVSASVSLVSHLTLFV